MATSETETTLSPGHLVWGGIESSEAESSEEEIYTAVSAVSMTRPTKGIDEEPMYIPLSTEVPPFVPKLALNMGDMLAQKCIGKDSGSKGEGRNRAKASRHQTRTPSPDSRMPSSTYFERKLDKLGHNSASDKAAPFKGAAEVCSEDEEVSTPRVRKYDATRPPPALEHLGSEVNYLNKPAVRSYNDADEEADLSDAAEEAEEAAEEGENVVADGPKSRKKKASRPFRATRIRYRKFMNDQYSAIAKDPLTFDLATIDIPACLVKERSNEAKVLLKLYLRAERAKQTALKAAPQASELHTTR